MTALGQMTAVDGAAAFADAHIPSPDDIYNDAVAFKPSIYVEQLRLQAAEKAILIAKAALYPTLSFNGSIGTNYYNTSGMKQDGFGKQLKNNFGQTLGLSLSVPLYNRFQTRNNVRSAEIDWENQQLTLDNARKTLYKEIQQVYYNTVAAQAKYRSAAEAEESSQEAFNLTEAKYENGKATITEFNEAKNNLMKSHSELLKAQYELVYQKMLITFYRNGQMTLAKAK